MNKVLVMARNNNCMLNLSRNIWVCLNTKLTKNQRSCPSIVHSKRQYHFCAHSYRLQFETAQSLICLRNGSPLFLPVCKFHFSSIILKNVKMSKDLKKTVNKQKNLENSNWNIQSDPGLSEILENMKTELESEEDSSNNSEKLIHEKDPELKNLLKEIRDDFQDGKYENKPSDDETLTKLDSSTPNMQNIEILHVEEDVIVGSEDGTTATVEIEDFTYVEEDDVPEWVPPIEMKRGVCGVFDITDIVTVLQTENAKDICVISLPEHLRLADYMVIVSGISSRHCKAISATIQWMYKRKKKSKDPSLKVEGSSSNDWLAYDLGNIILHIFLPDIRELYDLETLWTVGEKHDNRSLDIEDPFTIQQSDLEWLQELDIDSLQNSKKLKNT